MFSSFSMGLLGLGPFFYIITAFFYFLHSARASAFIYIPVPSFLWHTSGRFTFFKMPIPGDANISDAATCAARRSSVLCVVSFAFSSVILNFSVFFLVYLHPLYQTKSARTRLFHPYMDSILAASFLCPDTFYLAMDVGTNLVDLEQLTVDAVASSGRWAKSQLGVFYSSNAKKPIRLNCFVFVEGGWIFYLFFEKAKRPGTWFPISMFDGWGLMASAMG